MLELRPRDVAVITCVGDATAMDALGTVPNAMTCRVAPDETMLLSALEEAGAVVELATQRATAADPDAIVVDASDGWTAWSMKGDDVEVAFGRLSAVPRAAGFSQGDVARVPVKIVASDGTLDLLVPAMWGAYLRERILARCDDVIERKDPAAWARSEGTPS